MDLEPKIVILLSAYNGEDYLAEQLDSLLKQTYSNFIIIIRDDASTDSTCLLYTSPSPRDLSTSRMPSSA